MWFRSKLMILICLLLAVTFGIGGTLFITISFNTTLSEERDNAVRSYETTRNTLSMLDTIGLQVSYTDISKVLSQMEGQGTAQWDNLCLRNAYQTVYETGRMPHSTVELPPPESGTCVYVIGKDADGHYLQINSVFTINNTAYDLIARYNLGSAYSARDNLIKLYFRVYAVVVLAGFLIAFIISTTLTRPLYRLSSTAKKIAGGDLSRRSNIKAKDEIGMLSRNFDLMADRLASNIRRLEQEMERQESFMGAFAHELKTPMTAIIGYADLLRQDGLSDGDRMAAANYIFTEGQRLEKLSFKLLELILLEKDTLMPTTVRLKTVFLEVQRILLPVLKPRGLRLLCHCSEGAVTVEADLVKSLLYNLVDNAAKACDEPGAIALVGTVTEAGCIIVVEDKGRGMEQKELDRITEAFYRVDKARSRAQGGAGLGLALCRQIVELHDGTIRFESAPGQGTRVTVELRKIRRESV